MPHKSDVLKLVTAIDKNEHELVSNLLQIIPIETRVNDLGMTALNYVCANCDNWETIEAVTNWVPDINTVDAAGRTPLHNAARKLVDQHTQQVNLKLISALLNPQNGADIEAITTWGRETPMMYAVMSGKLQALAYFIHAGCSPFA